MVNDTWFRVLGYSHNELVGKHFKNITHPKEIVVDISEVKRLLTEPNADGYSLGKRYISKSGAIVRVELHVSAIRDEQKRVDFFAVTVLACPPSADQALVPRSSLLGAYFARFCDLILARPREFLAATVLGLFAVGRIPVSTLIELVKAYFAP